MTLANIIMIAGIVIVLLSLLGKDRTKKIEKDLEDLSINIYQETNGIKRRLKVVEEELLFDGPAIKTPQSNTIKPSPITPVGSKMKAAKPVHSIIVSQVLELGKQGLSVPEIQKRSALSAEQVVHILKNGGI